MRKKYLPTERWNKLLGIRDSYEAPAALWTILKDRKRREELFEETLLMHDFALDYDWFHHYFQDEHADRKQKKQDFTPNSVGQLLSRMVGAGSPSLDIAAGTGGLTIKKWYQDMRSCNPFEYRPSMFLYQAEELSSRSIPFLLFNMAIRGANAIIIHCDTLARTAWGAWFIQNDRDDYLRFSGIYALPHNQATADALLNLQWHADAVHQPVDPISAWPAHLGGERAKQELQEGRSIEAAIIGAAHVEKVPEQLSLF